MLLASAACCELDNAHDRRVSALRDAGVSARQLSGLDESDESVSLDDPPAPARPERSTSKRPRSASRSPSTLETPSFDLHEARFRRQPWDGKAVRSRVDLQTCDSRAIVARLR